MKSRKDSKIEVLKESSTINPRPDAVADRLFKENEFFDAHDLPQVKYEMIRRVSVENETVTKASSAFGFSRVAYYEIKKRFDAEGIVGLFSHKRGPKKAYKLTPEILSFVEEAYEKDASLKTKDLIELIGKKYGISIHRRSIERSLKKSKKKN